MDRDRILGGNALGVAIRLVLLSIVVGIVMSALGITPANFFYHLDLLIRRLYDFGFAWIEWLFRYFLVGAVVVFPIWIIVRLLGVIGKRSDDRQA